MDRNIIRHKSYCIVLVFWLVGVCYAGAPTAVITDSTGEQISVKYALVNEWVHFYGDESFDNDPEPENDQYVEAWGWTWSRYHEPTKFDGPQTCHFSCYWDTPGTRYIYLAVRDDEGVWSNYLMCTVHVVNISLQITSPTGWDRDVAFDDASTGVCEFTATGTTGVAALDDFLRWELTPIQGPDCNLIITSDPQQGPKVSTFEYEGLPSDNSEFGPKTLTLILDYPDIYREVSTTIKVFYEPTADNHPVLQDQGEGPIYAGTPNWFYYFRKDGVVDGMVVEDNGVRGFFYEDNDGGGIYYPAEDRLCLRSGALGAYNKSWYMENKWYGAVINAGANGVANSWAYAGDDVAAVPSGPYDPVVTPGTNGYLDGETICNYWGIDDEITRGISRSYDVTCDRLGNVAYTIRHEITHRTLFRRMAEPGAIDADGDYVEDNDHEGSNSTHKLCSYCCGGEPGESCYGYCTYDLASNPTYDNTPWDQEFMAYMSEITEGPMSIDEEKDWSKEGRQWHE